MEHYNHGSFFSNEAKQARCSYNSRAVVGRLTLVFRIFHSYVDVGNQILVQSGRAYNVPQANFTRATSKDTKGPVVRRPIRGLTRG